MSLLSRLLNRPVHVKRSTFVGLDGYVKSSGNPLYDEFMGFITSRVRYDFPETLRGYKDAFLASVLAMRCIQIRSQVIAGIPRRFCNGVGDDLPEQNPFVKLLGQGNSRLFKITETHLCIYGVAYWLPIRSFNRWDIRLLNPLSMEVLKDSYGIYGFRQRLNSGVHEWDAGELVYFYDYDPDDDLSGLPPTYWLLRTIGADISLEQFAKHFFENDATPGGILTTEQMLQTPDRERVRAEWEKEFRGSDKKHRLAVLGKGMSYESITPPLKDLAMQELDEKLMRRVALAYGVPMTIAGMSDAANYACLPAGELVYTPHGAISIESIKSGSHVWAWHEGGLRPRKVLASIQQPNMAEVFEVRTQHRTLRASDNHLLLTIKITPGINPSKRQINEYQWKRVDELTLQDYVVEAWSLPDLCNDTMPNGELCTIPFMELAGLYLADGCLASRNHALHFAIPDNAMGRYYQEVAESLFHYKRPHLLNKPFKTKRRAGAFGFSVGTVNAVNQYRQLGFLGDSLTKRIPSWVYSMEHDLRLALLRGYLDGDGTIGSRGACFASANDMLIHDLRVLAISCGLRVTNVGYQDRVSNFGKMHLARFNLRDADLLGTHDPKYDPHIERITKTIKRSNQRRYPRIVRNLDMPEGLQISRIVSIKPLGKMEVYDLSIEGDHTFIANGIVVHNTLKEQRQSLYTETILPQADFIVDTINNKFAPAFGDVHMEVNTNDIEVLQEDQAQVTTRSTQSFAGGVRSLNEARELEGLPALPIDIFTIPGAGIVARQDLEAGKLPQPASPFGLFTPPGAAASLESGDPTKTLESLCILYHIGADPDLIALQHQLQNQIPDVEWNAPDDFHITLLYAPQVSPEQQQEVVMAVKTMSIPKPELRIGSLQSFDNLGSHALHFRIRRNNELLDFQSELYDLCLDIGISPSAYSHPHNYKPHITLGYAPQSPGRVTFNSNLTVTPVGLEVTGDETRPGHNAILYQHSLEQATHLLTLNKYGDKATLDLLRNELKRWQKKVSTKGHESSFNPDYLPSSLADFIRLDLLQGIDPKTVFSKAFDAIKQGEGDFERYWRGIGGLYETIAKVMLQTWKEYIPRVANKLRRGEDYQETLDKMAGAQETALTEAITKIMLAGAARGGEVLDNARLTANPNKQAPASIGIAWDVINEKAVEWASAYAAQQIRYIGDTTRSAINEQVSAWQASGEPLSKLADAIEGELDLRDMRVPEGISPEKIRWLTSPARAYLIAQTETTDAFHQGVQETWKQAGVEQMRFRTQNDPHVCSICKSLNNKVGDIGSGWDDPQTGAKVTIPRHPGCRCYSSPVL